MPHYIKILSHLVIEPALQEKHREYLMAFARTRRVCRDPELALKMPDPLREAVDLPIGSDAAYFVGGTGLRGQDIDSSVTEQNKGPHAQPSVFCGWQPNWKGDELVYEKESGDGEEVLDWLQYVILKFLARWEYSVSGRGIIQGEDIEERYEFEIRGAMVVAKDIGGYADIPEGSPDGDDKTVPLVVLEDGDTYSGLDGCVVVEVPASQIDEVSENPKMLRDAEKLGWKVTHIADLV